MVVVVVVSPCPRASRDSTPAPGSALRSSKPTTANDRPDEPAPWCITKRGAALLVGGVR